MLTPPLPTPPGYALVHGGVPVWDPACPHPRDWTVLEDAREGGRWRRLRQAGPYYVAEWGEGDRSRLAVMVPDDRLDAYLEQLTRERGWTVEYARRQLELRPGAEERNIYEWLIRRGSRPGRLHEITTSLSLATATTYR